MTAVRSRRIIWGTFALLVVVGAMLHFHINVAVNHFAPSTFRATTRELDHRMDLPHHTINNNNDDNNNNTTLLLEMSNESSSNGTKQLFHRDHHALTTSTTLDDSQLQQLVVVDVEPDESFVWRGAQGRLCKHIQREQKTFQSRQANSSDNVTLKLHLQISCKQIHKRNQHGNFLLGYYGMTVAAMHFRADFTLECTEDAVQTISVSTKRQYLLWWLQSPPPNDEVAMYRANEALYDPPLPSEKDACKGVGKVALHYSSELARRDLRAMATALKPSFQSDNSGEGFDLDEVAIHFRCGDVLSSHIPKTDQNYGLLQFDAYRTRIPVNVTSIGIVTAPFAPSDTRSQDRPHTAMCRVLVDALVVYLETHFPGATLTVRNDPTESIPQVMSRLILAQYSFCARSTFCLFPALASFGTTSYVQAGGLAYFFDPMAKVYDNIHLMQGNFLRSSEINKKGFNYTLDWLVGTAEEYSNISST